MHEPVYPGQGLVVGTRGGTANVDGIDTGLAVDKERAAWFGTHGCLREGPRFCAGYVFDLIRGDAGCRGNHNAVVVE